jgi:hypothetical protein
LKICKKTFSRKTFCVRNNSKKKQLSLVLPKKSPKTQSSHVRLRCNICCLLCSKLLLAEPSLRITYSVNGTWTSRHLDLPHHSIGRANEVAVEREGQIAEGDHDTNCVADQLARAQCRKETTLLQKWQLGGKGDCLHPLALLP